MGLLKPGFHYDVSVNVSPLRPNENMHCCKRKHEHKRTEGFDIAVLTLCLHFGLCKLFHSENKRNRSARLHVNKRTNQKKLNSGPSQLPTTQKNMADVSVYEKLAEAVRSYPVLYDKNDLNFKDKNKKILAWDDVAKTVGLDSGKSQVLT